MQKVSCRHGLLVTVQILIVYITLAFSIALHAEVRAFPPGSYQATYVRSRTKLNTAQGTFKPIVWTYGTKSPRRGVGYLCVSKCTKKTKPQITPARYRLNSRDIVKVTIRRVKNIPVITRIERPETNANNPTIVDATTTTTTTVPPTTVMPLTTTTRPILTTTTLQVTTTTSPIVTTTLVTTTTIRLTTTTMLPPTTTLVPTTTTRPPTTTIPPTTTSTTSSTSTTLPLTTTTLATNPSAITIDFLSPLPLTNIYVLRDGYLQLRAKATSVAGSIVQTTMLVNGKQVARSSSGEVYSFTRFIAVVPSISQEIKVIATDSAGNTKTALRFILVSDITPGLFPSNPYYNPQEVAYYARDWGVNGAPLTVEIPASPTKIVRNFSLPGTNERYYTQLNNASESPEVEPYALSVNGNPLARAGSYDDVYVSGDSGHSQLNGPYQNASGVINLAYQPIQLTHDIGNNPLAYTKYYSSDPMSTMVSYGLNFSSRSQTMQGHYNSMDISKERDMYFLNHLFCAPAYLSYQEVSTEKIVDSYPALTISTFDSVGQSSSEIGAIQKFLLVGGSFSNTVKRMLKTTGNYPAVLQYIWRAALPYVDAAGNALPFTNEMRHRPAYLGNGSLDSPAWYDLNASYHKYNEDLHLKAMLTLAEQMTRPPAITILSFKDYTVRQGGVVTINHATSDPTAARIKGLTATSMLVIGKTGESVSVRVDLGASYDLNNSALTFELTPLYPEQAKNFTIRREGFTSVYEVTVKHDPAQPRMRMPVIVEAKNTEGRAVPAFINFFFTDTELYWNEYYSAARPLSEINSNLRPIVGSNQPEIIESTPGQSVTINLTCSDPEKQPTRWYRWKGEPGVLTANHFELPITMEHLGKSIPLHFVCSDGTGSYSSKQHTIVVPYTSSGMKAVNLGAVFTKGSFSSSGLGRFIASASGSGYGVRTMATAINLGVHQDNGLFTYALASGDLDVSMKIDSIASANTVQPPTVGLMIRKSLVASSDNFTLYTIRDDSRNLSGKTWAGYVTDTVADGGSTGSFLPSRVPYQRMVKRGSIVHGYASADGTTWEQIFGVQYPFGETVYWGSFLSSRVFNAPLMKLEAQATGQLLSRPIALTLPSWSAIEAPYPGFNTGINYREYTLDEKYTSVTFGLTIPPGALEARYSSERGGTPHKLYSGPVTFNQAGEYDLKAQVTYPNGRSDIVSYPFAIKLR